MNNMHREDILLQFMAQDEKILKTKAMAKKVKETHEYLMLEVSENANHQDRIDQIIKELKIEVEVISDLKLNKEIFTIKADHTDGWISTIEKRLKFQEHESL